MARCVLVPLFRCDYILFGYKVPQEANAVSNQLQFMKMLKLQIKGCSDADVCWLQCHRLMRTCQWCYSWKPKLSWKMLKTNVAAASTLWQTSWDTHEGGHLVSLISGWLALCNNGFRWSESSWWGPLSPPTCAPTSLINGLSLLSTCKWCFLFLFEVQGEDLIGVDANNSNPSAESQLLSASAHHEAPPQEQSDFVEILFLKARTGVRAAFTDIWKRYESDSRKSSCVFYGTNLAF